MKLINSGTNGNYQFFIYDDGTKIRILSDEESKFIPEAPENIDMKISNKCSIGCSFCHEKSCPNGKIADFDKWRNFLITLPIGTEVAIGGGALSEIPRTEFIDFLKSFPWRVVLNVTVNQKELEDEEFFKLLVKLEDERLINGIGVSYSRKSEALERLIGMFPKKVVVHTINGLLNKDDIEYLKSLYCKIIILGYKNFGRGVAYSEKFNKVIESNQKLLKDELCNNLTDHFMTISFDSLAIEQLGIRDIVSQDAWEKLYMGDDGEFSMYIDLVNEEYGKNSTTPHSERLKLLEDDSVCGIFKKLISANN